MNQLVWNIESKSVIFGDISPAGIQNVRRSIFRRLRSVFIINVHSLSWVTCYKCCQATKHKKRKKNTKAEGTESRCFSRVFNWVEQTVYYLISETRILAEPFGFWFFVLYWRCEYAQFTVRLPHIDFFFFTLLCGLCRKLSDAAAATSCLSIYASRKYIIWIYWSSVIIYTKMRVAMWPAWC